VIDCVQQGGDCGDEQKRGKQICVQFNLRGLCVSEVESLVLEIRVYVVDQLVCVLLCALACKDNFAC